MGQGGLKVALVRNPESGVHYRLHECVDNEIEQWFCIGDGHGDAGCGLIQRTQPPGLVCGSCGGMMLTQRAIEAAEKVAKTWEER